MAANDPYAAQQQAIYRRQLMAQQLMNQGQQPLNGQMVGGVYVAPSPVQGLANMLKSYAGARIINKGDQQLQNLATQRQQALAKAVKGGDWQSAMNINPTVGAMMYKEANPTPPTGMQYQGGKLAPIPGYIETKKAESIGGQPNAFSTFYNSVASQHPELTGNKLDAEVNKEWNAQQISQAKATGLARGQGYGTYRMYQVIDTKNGNRPVTISADDLSQANKSEPGRYITGTQGEKALTRTALISDIRGTLRNVRQALTAMPDFTAAQRAQIALVMKDRNPSSALSQFFGSQWGTTLNPQQQSYLIDLAQLKENAMAMRSVLGAGQGSDQLRAAIAATIPGPTTPNKKYGLEQLDKFEQVLNRLERGIPSVPLKAATGKISDVPTGVPEVGTVENGYKFIGGDPANPKSWKKQ